MLANSSRPSEKGTYGVIYFGFGRGEYPAQGASLTTRARRALTGAIAIDELDIEDTYGYPHQGMNEKGLFFVGAWTEANPSDAAKADKPQYDGVLVDHILKHAANVQEALKIAQQYSFPAPEGHLLFADPSGRSFIWETEGAILPGRGQDQVITNFLQSRHPEAPRGEGP